jgi:uncharacterized protein YndB with AHSA1/START domain
MSEKLTLIESIEFNAPKSKVWAALTQPEIIKQYFFGTDLKTTWEVGTPIMWHGEWEGTNYVDKGTVLSYIHEESLSHDYLSSMSGKEDIPENYAKISYKVVESEGKTTLTITQDNIENEEMLNHSKENLVSIMESHRILVE